jgi:hypothetical protein
MLLPWINRTRRCLLSNGFNICIDAANPEIWKSLHSKERLEKDMTSNTLETMAYCKKHNYLHTEDRMMMVVQYHSLQKVHTQMLQHAKCSLEDENGLIAAHRIKFHKLVTATLLIAVANDYTLDKEQTIKII